MPMPKDEKPKPQRPVSLKARDPDVTRHCARCGVDYVSVDGACPAHEPEPSSPAS